MVLRSAQNMNSVTLLSHKNRATAKILEAVSRGAELTQTGHVVTRLHARRLDGVIGLMKTDVGLRVTCLNFKTTGDTRHTSESLPSACRLIETHALQKELLVSFLFQHVPALRIGEHMISAHDSTTLFIVSGERRRLGRKHSFDLHETRNVNGSLFIFF